MGRSSKKAKRVAAVDEAATTTTTTMASNAANGEAAPAAEAERGGEGEAALLKRLNAVLAGTADRERKRAAALADGERAVLLAAVAAPLRAAEEELARLAAAEDALGRARAEAEARETDAEARIQAAVERIRAAEDEAKAAARRAAELEDLVAGFEAERSEMRAERGELEMQLEAMTASARDVQSQKEALESSFNELNKEGEVHKQEMEAKLGDQLNELEALHTKRAELEAKVSSLEAELSAAVARNNGLELDIQKMGAEMAATITKEEMEKKLQALFAEAEQKQSAMVAEVARLETENERLVKASEAAEAAHDAEKKTMEEKVGTLEAELEVAGARSRGLEMEVGKLETGMAANKEVVDKLQAIIAGAEQKQSAMVAQVARLESENERLAKAQEAAAMAVDAENKKMDVQLEMLMGNIDKIQSEKYDALVMVRAKEAEAGKLRDELNNLRSSMAELRARCHQLVEEKEAADVAHNAEKTKMEDELEMLEGSIDRIQAEKEDALRMVHATDAEAAKLRDELKKIQSSMAELRAHCDDLDEKSSSVQDEKILVLKELELEKAEAEKLKLKIQELESDNRDSDREIGLLKAEVTGRDRQISDLNMELEQLQLAVAEAQRGGNNVVWTWLGPATTTVVAAASFVYAARSR